MKIAEFVKTNLNAIIEYCQSHEDELINLQNPEYSKTNFGISKYALFIREDQLTADKKKGYYQKESFVIGEVRFKLCCQLYKKHYRKLVAYFNAKGIPYEGTVDDIEAEDTARRTNQARSNVTINCIEGLVNLITNDTTLPVLDRCRLLARRMVQESYFFSKEKVNERHAEILAALRAGTEKLPARFSTAKEEDNPYINEEGEPLEFDNKTKAAKYSKNHMVYFDYNGTTIPVQIDSDGNRSVRSIITKKSGLTVSQGNLSNFQYATISHIWGNAKNPLFFSNLWNLVIIPTYLNPILDKHELDFDDTENEGTAAIEDPNNFFNAAVTYVNNYYKKLCYQYYNLADKIRDYRNLGFNISEFFDIAVDKEINFEDIQHILGGIQE